MIMQPTPESVEQHAVIVVFNLFLMDCFIRARIKIEKALNLCTGKVFNFFHAHRGENDSTIRRTAL